MNFFRIFELFLQTHENKTGSNTQKNNNATREISVDQCHSQTNDDNSNKSVTESNVMLNNNEDYNENDSSVVNIDEFGVPKVLHNLTNVTPIKISPNDNTKEPKENELSSYVDVGTADDSISNNATDVSSVVHFIEDEPDINETNNDITLIQVTNKAMGSNDASHITEADTLNNVLNDETIENFKEFEEAICNIYKSDVGTDFINLDDFIEIFDELDAVNEDLVNGSVPNNENATDCKEDKEKNPNKNETNSNRNENIDIISINSSTDDEKSQTEEIKDTILSHAISYEPDSDDGYNSSDFEFISETEAKMTGFVINYGLIEDNHNLSPVDSEPLIYLSGQYFGDDGEKVSIDPGEGPSRQDRPRNEFEDRSYRNDHHIPLEDDYLELFQGIYNPQLPMSEIYFLENKSVRASAMNSQYDGIGFDRQLALRRHQPDSSEDEFEDEAKASAKKILNMYPGENKKRRRRYL